MMAHQFIFTTFFSPRRGSLRARGRTVWDFYVRMPFAGLCCSGDHMKFDTQDMSGIPADVFDAAYEAADSTPYGE
jgi:hypothetical protein